MSIILIYFILRDIPLLDDAIGIKKELRVIAICLLIIVITGVVFRFYPSIIAIDHDIHELQRYISIVIKSAALIMRFCDFAMNYMQTRMVVTKLVTVRRNKSLEYFEDSTAITLSTTKFKKMRNIAYQKTICLMEQPNDTLYPNEREKLFQMMHCLRSNTAFEAFMRELRKEYCEECLLSIVEMTQFKERIFAESSNQKRRELMSESAERRIADIFLQLPAECVKSAIVYESNTYKSAAREIYLKYIEPGAPYEINVEHRTRKQLQNLIGNDHWESNRVYDDPQRL